jgi:hypothetical protein
MDKQLRRLFRNTAPICCSPNHEGRATKVVNTELFVEGAESIRLVDPRAEISRGFQLTFERCDRDSDKIQVQLQIDAQSEIARLLRVLQDRTGQQVVFNSCNGHDRLTLGESIASDEEARILSTIILFVSLDNKVPKVKCRTRNGTIFRRDEEVSKDLRVIAEYPELVQILKISYAADERGVGLAGVVEPAPASGYIIPLNYRVQVSAWVKVNLRQKSLSKEDLRFGNKNSCYPAIMPYYLGRNGKATADPAQARVFPTRKAALAVIAELGRHRAIRGVIRRMQSEHPDFPSDLGNWEIGLLSADQIPARSKTYRQILQRVRALKEKYSAQGKSVEWKKIGPDDPVIQHRTSKGNQFWSAKGKLATWDSRDATAAQVFLTLRSQHSLPFVR